MMNADNKHGSELILTQNISDCDDFYDELLRAHEPLDKEQSDAFNARLIMILCNHIGDRAIISAALNAARLTVDVPAASDDST